MAQAEELQTPAPVVAPEPEKELFTWKAPSRPFKRRDRQFWTTAITIAVIFGIITFLAEGMMPVIVIISIVFLYYVLSTVEPEIVTFTLTNYGVKVVNQLTAWQNLNRFWFSKRYNDEVVVFETNGFLNRLEIVINPKDKEKIRPIVKKYLTEEEAPPSGLDKAVGYFSQKLPGFQTDTPSKK